MIVHPTRRAVALGLAASATAGCALADGGRRRSVSPPLSATVDIENIHRIQGIGDNWCMTWAADGSVISALCDGEIYGRPYHSRLVRVDGPRADAWTDLGDFPAFEPRSDGRGSWFTYGVISVDGALYAAASRTPGSQWSGPFQGVKLLRSDDGGASWMRIAKDGGARALALGDEAALLTTPEEMFFLHEDGRQRQSAWAYPFSYWAFAQHGQDDSLAQDEFVYIFSPEGAATHELNLARAPRTRLGERSAWRYFAGRGVAGPLWSDDLRARQPVHVFPDRGANNLPFGWYSWLPSVLWNQALGVYVMANGGTYAGFGLSDSDKDYFEYWMHERTGSLVFWWAEAPWGPWTQIAYDPLWIADHPANLTYQPKLSSKWISEDGRDMTLVWSDARKDDAGRSHTINYTWNEATVRLDI